MASKKIATKQNRKNANASTGKTPQTKRLVESSSSKKSKVGTKSAGPNSSRVGNSLAKAISSKRGQSSKRSEPTGSSVTRPVEAGNLGFVIDRLGQDCGPDQYVRELFQNSLDAIARLGKKSRSATDVVALDVDWAHLKSTGYYKLAFIDNGIGMTEEDLVGYVNAFGSSSGEQSADGNYGIGAKIAAATKNPQGLRYRSWQRGEGIDADFHKDPVVGYGLRAQRRGRHVAHTLPSAKNVKPLLIDKHGTSVTLLGYHAADNTLYREGDAERYWLTRYLNTRYLSFPSRVDVYAREMKFQNPNRWAKQPEDGKSTLAPVLGMEHYLLKYSTSFGSADLGNCVVHWYILSEGTDPEGGRWEGRYHTAVRYQNELYDFKRTKEARSRLVQFGLRYASQQVVLHFEPKLDVLAVHPDIARTTINQAVNGNSVELPWEEWSKDFRENFPTELAELEESVFDKTASSNYDESLEKNLADMFETFGTLSYLADESGSINAIGENVGAGSNPSAAEESSTSGGVGSSGSKSTSVAGVRHGLDRPTNKNGKRAKTTTTLPDRPEVRWVSEHDGTRTDGYLDNCAAEYHAQGNIVIANRDFLGYTNLCRLLENEYEHLDPRDIRANVECWSTVALIEAVMGTKALAADMGWDVEEMLSPSALTVRALPSLSNYRSMRRPLGARHGASR